MPRNYLIRNFIIFIIISFVFLFLVVRIFGGHPKEQPNPTPAPTAPVVKPLPEYADTYAEVSYMTDGHINGDDKHRAIKITVDQFQRKLNILGGYNYNVIEEHTFPNNQQAYEVFLKAINNEGFTLKRSKSSAPKSETGQCPLGTRTILELNDSGDSLSRLWTSSCGLTSGTFAGHASAVQQLFQAQITDYNKLISNSKVQL
jgi:hypothetical protein